MGSKILFVMIIFIVGCERRITITKMTKKECVTEAQGKTLAAFVIECSKAANPMSDEEGEDLVRQCHLTGQAILCPPKMLCMEVLRGGFLQSTEYGDWKECGDL